MAWGSAFIAAAMNASGARTTKGMKAKRTNATSGTCAVILVASVLLGGCGGSTAASDHTARDDKSLRDLVDRTVAAAMKRDFVEYGKYYAQQRALRPARQAYRRGEWNPEDPAPRGLCHQDGDGQDRVLRCRRSGLCPGHLRTDCTRISPASSKDTVPESG